MNEIVDITTFLTKQGIYPDMQKEILSYYDQDMYIDILRVLIRYSTNENWRTWCERKFKHTSNRRDHNNILKQYFLKQKIR